MCLRRFPCHNVLDRNLRFGSLNCRTRKLILAQCSLNGFFYHNAKFCSRNALLRAYAFGNTL